MKPPRIIQNYTMKSRCFLRTMSPVPWSFVPLALSPLTDQLGRDAPLQSRAVPHHTVLLGTLHWVRSVIGVGALSWLCVWREEAEFYYQIIGSAFIESHLDGNDRLTWKLLLQLSDQRRSLLLLLSLLHSLSRELKPGHTVMLEMKHSWDWSCSNWRDVPWYQQEQEVLL